MCARSEQRDIVVRKPLYLYVTHHGNYMIPHSDVLSVSSESYLTVRPLQLASFLSLGHADFSQKIMQDPLFFAPVLTNKIPARKLIASAKIPNYDHRERRSVPQSSQNSACPFS